MWKPPPNGNIEFGGLWQFANQLEEYDQELASMQFGLKAPHGTYTKICYHRVVAHSLSWEKAKPVGGFHHRRPLPGGGTTFGLLADAPADINSPIPNMALEVFDEEGNFGHFVWNCHTQWGKGEDEVGAWEFRYEKILCDVPKGHPLMPNGDKLELSPSLALTPFSEKDAARFPRNGTNNSGRNKNVPCPLPFVPSGSAPPRQYIYYESGTHELVWVLPVSDSVSDDDVKLVFAKQEPQPLLPTAPTVIDNWGNLFAQSTVQWEFPLAGWNPANLGSTDSDDFVYQKQGQPISHTGTPTGTFKRQSLAGKPIFAIPDPESADYVEAQKETKVFLPLGAKYERLDWEQEATTSDMVSSTADRVNSWGLTMGISAGIEKVLTVSEKGSYHQKIENQQEHETRYSVTRRVKRSYILFTEVKNLRLDEDYKEFVLASLRHLNEGDTPDWKNFVYNFGTHYAHVLTYGKTDFAETQYSLDAEAYAYEKTIKIEESAKATLDGIKFGEEASVDFNWGQKIGGKVSHENVTHTIIGADGDALIFLDLRPAWELFSPVFFPPNFTEFAGDEEAVAPFIWHKLRESFRKYLEEQIGVNGELDASLFLSYSPIIVKVVPTGLRFPYGSGRSTAIVAIGWEPTMGTTLLEWNNFCLPVRLGIDSAVYQSSPELLSKDTLTKLFEPVQFTWGDLLPGQDKLYCIMAATPGSLRKKVDQRNAMLDSAGFNLLIGTIDSDNDYGRESLAFQLNDLNAIHRNVVRLEVLQGEDQFDSILAADPIACRV